MNFVIGQATEKRLFFSGHKHEEYEIIVFEKGASVLEYENGKKEVKAGDIVIIPPKVLHHFTRCGGFEYYYFFGAQSPLLNCTEVTLLNFPSSDEAITLMRLIYLNRYSTNQDYRDALVNAFLLLLSNSIHYDDLITSAVNAVALEITRNFTNPKLNAREALVKSGYAEDYIRAKFRSITGKTPNEFLTETRINHAKKLIDAFHGTAPLGEIAMLCGYDDYPYFSRKFKTVTKISPREYLLKTKKD